MKRIVEFLLEQGGSILVEVDNSGPKPCPVRGPNSGEVVTKANQTFKSRSPYSNLSGRATMRSYAAGLRDPLRTSPRRVSRRPDR
jgi:hypothetical protein